jgi:hopanoid biosynthesis associated protein HpnK
MGSEPTAACSGRRRLIVNADDFGRSSSINAAIIRAHREGILTSASLMVNEAACPEAVALAKENPKLGVGLHLTFLCGHSALPVEAIPDLVNARNEFAENPPGTGFRYFFARRLREQLRAELRAQFSKFRATGLPLDHVNGHLHLHLHPVIFRILMQEAAELSFDRFRLTYDPLWLNLHLASGKLLYRVGHALIFNSLAARARPVLKSRGFKHTGRVFGLLQNARVDEDYVHRLLSRLPPGDSELYSHPSLDEFKLEFQALISARVRHQSKLLGIELIRYQDL